MSIDRDYPLARAQVLVLVGGLVAMGVVGALLFGGFIPGLKPDLTGPSTVTIGGVTYYTTMVQLVTPSPLANSTTPQPYLFHNVSFELWVTNWDSFTGGLVWGNGTEPNGSAFPFVLGDSAVPPVHTNLYLSPDRDFGASWPGGLLGGSAVELLVRV